MDILTISMVTRNLLIFQRKKTSSANYKTNVQTVTKLNEQKKTLKRLILKMENNQLNNT